MSIPGIFLLASLSVVVVGFLAFPLWLERVKKMPPSSGNVDSGRIQLDRGAVVMGAAIPMTALLFFLTLPTIDGVPQALNNGNGTALGTLFSLLYLGSSVLWFFPISDVSWDGRGVTGSRSMIIPRPVFLPWSDIEGVEQSGEVVRSLVSKTGTKIQWMPAYRGFFVFQDAVIQYCPQLYSKEPKSENS
ncbi:MAG: hypothetical protein AAGH41_02090 [Pseudomonadota bacterium]